MGAWFHRGVSSVSRFRNPAVLLAITVALLGLASMFAQPLLDDGPQFAHVAGFTTFAEQFGADCFGFWRPAKNLFFTFALAVGLPVAHLAALLIYGLAAYLLYRNSHDLGFSPGWAMLATAVWALAPTQVSSLAWLSGTNIVAMTAFALLALACWREDARPAVRIAGLAAFACSLLCYEGAIALPALWILSELYRSARLRFSRIALLATPWILVSGIYLWLRTVNGGVLRAFNDAFPPDLAPQKLTAASASFVCEHLSLWLWPFGRQAVLGVFVWPAETAGLLRLAFAWLVVAALLVAIWLLRRRRPLVSFGLAWFVVAFFPTSNFIPLRCGPFADYYLVFPSIGLALAFADSLRWLVETLRSQPGRAAFVRTALIALVLWRGAAASVSFGWARAWNDEQLLLERSLSARPDAFNVKSSLASLHVRQQRTEEAERLANEAVREAPWYSQTYFVLGQVALNQKRIPEAKKIFTDAAARSPREAYPLAALGYIADEIEQDPAAAKKFYRDALKLRWSENSGTAALNLAVLLATEGKVAESRKLMESVLPRMSDNADLLRNLAIACKQLGDLPAAEAYHARFLQLRSSKRP